METRISAEEYVRSKEFADNLKKQAEFVKTYKSKKTTWRHSPYYEWKAFMESYIHFRACLASLRNNPDTKDDSDFKELCETWNRYKDFYPHADIDFKALEDMYLKLRKKTVFGHNPFFGELSGAFLKSVYQLFTESVYWKPFFDLE